MSGRAKTPAKTPKTPGKTPKTPAKTPKTRGSMVFFMWVL
jgi:hypothetical protein